MKKCPYCAEEIQDDAIYCRFCNNDITVEPTTKAGKKQKREQSWIKVLLVLIGLHHLWTIGIGFAGGGLFGAALTMFTPVLATIYWFFRLGSEYTFFTFYHAVTLLLAVLFLIGTVIDSSKS